MFSFGITLDLLPKSDRKETQYSIILQSTQNRQIAVIVTKVDFFYTKFDNTNNSVNLYVLYNGMFHSVPKNLPKPVLSDLCIVLVFLQTLKKFQDNKFI